MGGGVGGGGSVPPGGTPKYTPKNLSRSSRIDLAGKF